MRVATVLSMAVWAALVAANAAGLGAEPRPAKKVDDKKNTWKPGKITISKETTRITGPLRKDGYVDYVEALNRRASQGVTPENNAAVLLLRAMGPGVVDKEIRTAYFKRLGIELLPEKGDYFLDLQEYLKNTRPKTWEGDLDRIWDDDVSAWDRPWSAKQYPLIAGWLTANEKPLQLVAEAVRRPRYYSPVIVSKDDPWIGLSGFHVNYGEYRGLIYPLGARAMLRVKSGQIDGAREDALTCHFLARRLAHGPSLIDYLVARAIDSAAFNFDMLIAHHGDLSAKQAKRHADDLAELPPMMNIAHQVRLNERYIFLDAVGHIARDGPSALIEALDEFEADKEDKAVAKRLDRLIAITGVDWDHVLRRGNFWYDQLAAATGRQSRAARVKAVSDVFDRLNRRRKDYRDIKALSDKILSAKSRRRRLSEAMGDYLAGLLLPDGDGWSYRFFYKNIDDKQRVSTRTALLAFALAAHRADHGAYPKTLSKLAPKYIAKLPQDPFADADFRYRQDGKGYVLYSVGPNGKDDGGIDPDSELVIEGLAESDDRVISTAK